MIKQLFSISIFWLFFAYFLKQQSDKKTNLLSENIEVFTFKNVAIRHEESNIASNYQISTYDNPEFATQLISHKKNLQQLSEQNFFSTISAKLVAHLKEQQQKYFIESTDYELIGFAKGSIIQKNSSDYAFIVFDKKNLRVSILIYNSLSNKYLELFRGMKVINGLETANCNYKTFGTVDFLLAEQIIYQKKYLIENPERFLESTPLKIVDISKDSTFILNKGYFSKQDFKTNLSNSLCISTSSVYNDWECFKYNKATNTFLIFYGQTFAD